MLLKRKCKSLFCVVIMILTSLIIPHLYIKLFFSAVIRQDRSNTNKNRFKGI